MQNATVNTDTPFTVTSPVTIKSTNGATLSFTGNADAIFNNTTAAVTFGSGLILSSGEYNGALTTGDRHSVFDGANTEDFANLYNGTKKS